jgi:hypothetical protein
MYHTVSANSSKFRVSSWIVPGREGGVEDTQMLPDLWGSDRPARPVTGRAPGSTTHRTALTYIVFLIKIF